MFNGVVDYINTTLGIATPKLRLLIFRTKNGGSAGYDATDYANVVAAQTDIGSNYLTDNPSYSSKVQGTTSQTTDDLTLQDTQHYDATSLNTMGVRAVTYFQPFQFAKRSRAYRRPIPREHESIFCGIKKRMKTRL